MVDILIWEGRNGRVVDVEKMNRIVKKEALQLYGFQLEDHLDDSD